VAHHPGAEVIILFLRDAPGAMSVLLLTLAVALWLTVVELRELRPHWKWWAWWLSFVFLTHFVGYLALRAYSAYYRRRNRARA
jgi:O-antigen ligase